MNAKDHTEEVAFHYVSTVLGVRLEQYDHSGRQGAVDALLHYPDGHIAALEVTSAAGEGRRQLYSLINENQTLPNPGAWTWRATIDDPRDFPAFLTRLEALILKSEALGIRKPTDAYREAVAGDEDFAWIIGSSVELWGSPELPKIRPEDGAERPLILTQGGSGGGVDETLSGFGKAIATLLAEQHITKRINKLARSGHDERHLFVVADDSALPFPISYALMARDVAPPGKPPLPENLTHLWLVVPFSPWLLIGNADGWRRIPREDLNGRPRAGRRAPNDTRN